MSRLLAPKSALPLVRKSVVRKESPGGHKKPKDQPPILAIDFDGRIAENRTDRNLEKTKPREGCKEALDRLKAAGVYLLVWTARPDTEEVKVWMKRNKIPFDSINENKLFDTGSRKVYADMYLDDRGEGDPDAEWDDLLPEIADRLFEKTHQPISKYDDFEALEELAKPGVAELEKMLVNALNFPVIRITDELRLGELEASLIKPGGLIVIAPVKKKKRATEKVESDYDGDWRRLSDIVRGSVAVDSLKELFNAVKRVSSSAGRVVRLPKDRFKEPLSNGYRDYLVNYRLPSGLVCEVQYHLKPILIAREREKVAYDVVRAIRASMEEEGREEMTPAEAEACRRARKASESIYARAWEESGEGHGPTNNRRDDGEDNSSTSNGDSHFQVQDGGKAVETFYRCPYCNGSRAEPNGPRPSDGQLVSGGNAGTDVDGKGLDVWRAGEETSTLSSRVIQEAATCPDCKMTFSIAGRYDLIVKMLLCRYVTKRTGKPERHREGPPRARGHVTVGPPPRPRKTPPANAQERQRAIMTKARGAPCEQGETAAKTGCIPVGPTSALPSTPRDTTDTLANAAVLNRPAPESWNINKVETEDKPSLGSVGQRNHALVTQSIKRAKITSDRKELYAKAMRKVMERIPESAHQRMGQNLTAIHFFQNVRAVTEEAWNTVYEAEERKELEEQLRNHYGSVDARTVEVMLKSRKSGFLNHTAVGGFYLLEEKSLRFDGESPTGEVGMGRRRGMMSEHIYAHEMTHAVDGPKSELSNTQEWIDVATEEILRTNYLTQYAKTNQMEAFAEFGRLLYAGDIPIEEVERTFPKCSAYFKKIKLWPE